VLPLAELRTYADGPLADLPLLRKGNRLSVMPVTPAQWEFILALENR
jgi:predicted RNA-binding protein with PUA-like domain